jgi:hypothetical protein
MLVPQETLYGGFTVPRSPHEIAINFFPLRIHTARSTHRRPRRRLLQTQSRRGSAHLYSASGRFWWLSCASVRESWADWVRNTTTTQYPRHLQARGFPFRTRWPYRRRERRKCTADPPRSKGTDDTLVTPWSPIYWTGLLMLDHSYLVENLTNSKIAETKALEPLKSWHFCINIFRTC